MTGFGSRSGQYPFFGGEWVGQAGFRPGYTIDFARLFRPEAETLESFGLDVQR